ncbi:MAG: DUF488 domain-containing protein [Abditibacteriaceae bacterium]
MSLRIKRAYEDASKSDGFRVLVDRIWPRGVSKEDAKIDLWLKEIAPSTELRKSFGHDPDKWGEFQKKFEAEIHDNKDVWKQLKDVVKEHPTVTLVYAAKDEEHNNAVVLQKLLKK